MRLILGCALAVVLSLGTGLRAEDKKDAIDAKKLIGRWGLKEKEEDNEYVMEFLKDGKMTLSGTDAGKAFKYDYTYKIDGNKVIATEKVTGKDETYPRFIVKLTATELVTKDDRGNEERLVRLKAK